MGHERGGGNGVAQHPLLLRQSETIEKVIDNGYADGKRILGLFFRSFGPLSRVCPGSVPVRRNLYPTGVG
jgi:hypothetical protein